MRIYEGFLDVRWLYVVLFFYIQVNIYDIVVVVQLHPFCFWEEFSFILQVYWTYRANLFTELLLLLVSSVLLCNFFMTLSLKYQLGIWCWHLHLTQIISVLCQYMLIGREHWVQCNNIQVLSAESRNVGEVAKKMKSKT